MLLQFTAENFRSIRDEVELSMRAANPAPPADTRSRPVVAEVRDDLQVLRCAAIYGANASGKSNLVEAMLVVRQLAVHGTSSKDARLGLQPFRLDAQRMRQPSSCELYVLVGQQVYGYGFAATNEAITEETLTVMIDGEETEVFSRRDGQFQFSSALGEEVGDPKFLEYVARGTPNNQLFLYEATRRNVESRAIDDVSQWLAHLEIIQPSARLTPLKLVKLADSDPEFRAFLVRMVSWADTGIKHLAIDRRRVDVETARPFDDLPALLDVLSRTSRIPEALVPTDDGGVEELALELRHSDDTAHPPFNLEDESDGTRRLLDLAPLLYTASRGRAVLVIDELDRSLHTLLAQQIITTFIEHLPATAQLVFTTHDTNLLDCRMLRPDCIWFTEKSPEGATTLFSLAEFRFEQLEVLRKDLEKGYLRGRFGGIPFLGDPEKLGWLPREDPEP